MSESRRRAEQLLQFYTGDFRQFLQEQRIQGVEALDRQAEVLGFALARPAEVKIGFVGESQVGKSTLINALLNRQALPSGGIGPLTAQATRVTHSAEDRLTVTYHGKGALHRLAFALERYLERRGDLVPVARVQDEVPEDLDGALDVDVLLEDPLDEETEVATPNSKAEERATYLFAQTRRMMGATPQISDPLLVDALLTVLERSPRSSSETLEPMLDRCREIRDRLGKQESISFSQVGGRTAFQHELRLRAAGWLSPLVSQLSLELTAPEVDGLTIVDLPGIGVVGDPAANEAQRFVETEGDALVLVFRNSGVTQSIAGLLERTGVITKLLFGGRDGESPIHVVIAVTHLDDVAKTQFTEKAEEANEHGTSMPDRNVLFTELAAEMETTIRVQVADALRGSKSFDELEPSQRQPRVVVIDRLCEEMRIVCVSAPDYMQKRVGPDLGLSFLTDVNATGIPTLREAVRSLAKERETRRTQDIEDAQRSLVVTLDAHLASLRKSLDEGHGVAQAEWEAFCAELTKFADPLRLEMTALHSEVITTLRRGLLERIDTLCGEAETRGLKKLTGLLRAAKALHFQSLNAALRRDGVWETRGVNFPANLTLAIVDTIASEWEPRIIEGVRAEIRRLADRDLKLVEQLVKRATELDPKIVEATSIEEQKKILQQNSRSAVAWTRDQLEELRDTVRTRLRDTVSKPIERACKAAIKAGRNTDRGAKDRILEVFEDGSQVALAEARDLAKHVLQESYRKLLKKLDEGYLKDFHDPVASALEVLTDQTAARARRRDARKRKSFTEALLAYTEALDAVRPLPGNTEAA